MNETQSEPIRLPRSPCDVLTWREKQTGKQVFTRRKKGSIQMRDPSFVIVDREGPSPHVRRLCDTSGCDVSVLCEGLG